MIADLLLPIPGVPDELIRALNARFRQLAGVNPATGQPNPPGVFFTSKNRPDANGTAVGTFGAETDTGTLYQVQTVGNRQIWVHVQNPHFTVPVSIDTGALPPAAQLAIRENNNGAIELVSYNKDDAQVLFDLDYTGTQTICRSAVTARIVKSSIALNFYFAALQTIGNAVSDAISAAMSLSSGDWDFATYINACAGGGSGGFKMGGTAGIGTNASPITIPLAKITPGGTNGSFTVKGGIVTARTDPT